MASRVVREAFSRIGLASAIGDMFRDRRYQSKPPKTYEAMRQRLKDACFTAFNCWNDPGDVINDREARQIERRLDRWRKSCCGVDHGGEPEAFYTAFCIALLTDLSADASVSKRADTIRPALDNCIRALWRMYTYFDRGNKNEEAHKRGLEAAILWQKTEA